MTEKLKRQFKFGWAWSRAQQHKAFIKSLMWHWATGGISQIDYAQRIKK